MLILIVLPQCVPRRQQHIKVHTSLYTHSMKHNTKAHTPARPCPRLARARTAQHLFLTTPVAMTRRGWSPRARNLSSTTRAVASSCQLSSGCRCRCRRKVTSRSANPGGSDEVSVACSFAAWVGIWSRPPPVLSSVPTAGVGATVDMRIMLPAESWEWQGPVTCHRRERFPVSTACDGRSRRRRHPSRDTGHIA